MSGISRYAAFELSPCVISATIEDNVYHLIAEVLPDRPATLLRKEKGRDIPTV